MFQNVPQKLIGLGNGGLGCNWLCKTIARNVQFMTMDLKRKIPVNFVIKNMAVASKYDYIMAGHAIMVVKDITLLFCHGNAVILTLW